MVESVKYGKPTAIARMATMRNTGSPPSGGFQFAAGVIAESQVFARYPVRQIDSTRIEPCVSACAQARSRVVTRWA